jgi:hypothetical protein
LPESGGKTNCPNPEESPTATTVTGHLADQPQSAPIQYILRPGLVNQSGLLEDVSPGRVEDRNQIREQHRRKEQHQPLQGLDNEGGAFEGITGNKEYCAGLPRRASCASSGVGRELLAGKRFLERFFLGDPELMNWAVSYLFAIGSTCFRTEIDMDWPIDGFDDIQERYFARLSHKTIAAPDSLKRRQNSHLGQILKDLGEKLARNRFRLGNGVD